MHKRDLVAIAAVCCVSALSVPALAAEQGGETDIFNADIGNFVFTLVIFALVIGILGKFAWKPLLTVLNDREKTIRESLESARRERADAQKLLADYQAQLDKAREEATAVVEEGRRDAEVVRRRLQEEARQQAQETLARARREIQLATDTAVKELYDRTAELSVQVAGGIIRKELSPADHGRLVADALEEMKDSGPAGLS